MQNPNLFRGPQPPTFPTFPAYNVDTPAPPLSRLLKSAFRSPASSLSLTPPQPIPTSYRAQQPSCVSRALINGTGAAVIGSVFGAVIGMSTAMQSGYKGSAMSYAGSRAVRNAAALGGWNVMFTLSACALTKLRKRRDLLNPAAAGAFTGGVLTVAAGAVTGAAGRNQWRYGKYVIAANAAVSAVVAIALDALNLYKY